jgi:amino acid transporter
MTRSSHRLPSLRPTYWSDKITVATVVAAWIVLCVCLVIPYNDTSLLKILSGSSGGACTAAASPYVIAMKNLGITGLSHLTNALLCTSIFSADSAYTYYDTCSLYALSLDGHAPKVPRKCMKSGVLIYCLIGRSIFLFLGFLNVSSSSAKVLTWLTSIVAAAQIIDYIVICITYLLFYRACKAQGVDRRAMPCYTCFQPHSSWVALIVLTCVVTCYEYSVSLPGRWAIDNFFKFYLMVLVAPFLLFGWKVLKRTKSINPLEADLVWQKPVIDAYEEAFDEPALRFW